LDVITYWVVLPVRSIREDSVALAVGLLQDAGLP
jgi:hypothetical protein